MPRLIVCLVAAAAAFNACTQKDAQGRRPLRCCAGKPSFVVAILHGERIVGRPPANGALPVTNINSAWSDDEWARVARERRASAFLTYHQRCGDARAPLESFRLSQILSFGGLVVAENSDTEDVALFEDIIRVEKKFYGDWSKETRQLLADGDALAAYKRRAFDLYRQRFAPEALLRRVDAWNERGAPDGWQDS